MFRQAVSLAFWATTVLAQIPGETLTGVVGNSTIAGCSAGPDANGKYEIRGTNIRANFVPYAGAISNLFINNNSGIERDVVGGWDNASYYSIDAQQPHFGSVPGHYANRIKNSNFEIDGVTYNVTPNEHPTPKEPLGANQLHGGTDGWDWRNWTVVAHTFDSITFSLTDPDGKEGFPGEVISYKHVERGLTSDILAYALGNMTWDLKIVAIATTKKTLSSHTYWNLDGFANNETDLVFNHTMYVPFGGPRTDVDSILIPTGDFLSIPAGSEYNSWTAPKIISAAAAATLAFNTSAGYDACFINTRPYAFSWREGLPVAILHSPCSGIQVDIHTDQDAFQFYSCGDQNGSIALKSTQGLRDVADRPRVIPQCGCVVMEVQDYIGGLNYPGRGRSKKQIFGPGDYPYVLQASYRFSLNSTAS
ncbi:aldose 1-epimeras-like protein [Calycina marina]|uniref:Aldose 1-epimeras-like protein n=1 Tax=Calycina marina TaxID=1763456 RepID=A0A9P7YXF2_9HELO|nr:aldose 1-epimeras-like protein [Calycina marina]